MWPVQCGYFAASTCRSCTLMGEPYPEQVTALEVQVRAALRGLVPPELWTVAYSGPESGFRNKAKLAVGGKRGAPTFGITDRAGRGVDLRDCGLYEPGLHVAVGQVAQFVAALGLTPYDVAGRTGELKHVLLTHSPGGETMIRFVLRSPGQLGRLERAVPDLLEAVPSARVVSANLLPEHRAALEGQQEIALTAQEALRMHVNDVDLWLRPRSFFQTNTDVAAALYRQVRDWIGQIDPASVLDLFCGVGGFALHAATANAAHLQRIHGIEIEPEAVQSARSSASDLAVPRGVSLGFDTGDAERALAAVEDSDAVIVNPPRRGIGTLTEAVERSRPAHLIYSSCNVDSLARDLAALPSYRVRRARLFDMFPQTRHHEVLVHAELID